MTPLTPAQKRSIILKIRRLVLKLHINVAGIDYNQWKRLVDDRTAELACAETEQFETGVRQLLGELQTSHTTFLRGIPEQLRPQHTINATLRKASLGDRDHWVFLDVFEDGPAARAGIKPGQILCAVDREPVREDSPPMFSVGRQYTFTIGSAHSETRVDVVVEIPVVKGSKAHPALVPPKTIATKILDGDVGVLKIGWFTATMGLGFARELDSAIGGLKRTGCDRLIIDLRGNIGGGLGFARLASYLCPGEVAIGQSLTPRRLRSGYHRESLPRIPMPNSRTGLIIALTRFLVKDKSLVLLTQGLGHQPFHGRVAIMVNEFTYSAAEMVANFAQENALALIVGTKTAGMVLGGRNLAVGGGYWLGLPVFGWFTSRGETIEGQGVVPNIQVDALPELLRVGRDEQLAAAVEAINIERSRQR